MEGRPSMIEQLAVYADNPGDWVSKEALKSVWIEHLKQHIFPAP
jgi:hypothetical protein